MKGEIGLLYLKLLACALLSYLIGCINPSYIIARIRGFDIRQKGSGNAGASNAVVTMGKAVGIFSAFFDIFKVCIAAFACERLFQLPSGGFAVSAVCCSLGHIFPVFMGFKGGKGLACLAGMAIMYNWKFFLIALACEIVLAMLTDYICVVSITAPAAFTVFYAVTSGDAVGAVLFALMTAVMFGRHIDNLRRIRLKTEMRLSYLWNPEKETSRMKENIGESRNG